jgi:hypothetical protein
VSDLSTGAYAPASGIPEDASTAQQVAGQGKQAATQAAAEVKDTAKEQAQRVGAEAKTQAHNLASDVRDRASEQARTQNDKLVSTIRETAGQLDEMRGDRTHGPAAAVVSRVADSGRQLADYLDHHGPEGVLQEVQDFARRRPGAFLATALVAGFVVGRLGKSVAKADPDAGSSSGRHADPVASGYAYGTPAEPVITTPYDTTSSADLASAAGAGAPYAGTSAVIEDPYAYPEPRS